MSLQPVQLNIIPNAETLPKRTVKSYRDANVSVQTDDNVKPLPPKGHLVDDNWATGIKYFFKDIGYDIKSVRNGYIGIANDHQLGRLNDVGLRLGGIGIAAYLASQTTNPKARLMEYIGLAVFLTSMSIYPKIAINTPARIVHGFDIDKEYIDDQGRKKSVYQDSNYIPYDMFNGLKNSEDLDVIGDRMGIPRDIKNRHDVIREQMRKIATQNNTLWMLTAGFATPLMTALLCSGLEKYVVSPSLERARNNKYNYQIQTLLDTVNKGNNDYGKIKSALGDSVKSIISKYEGKILPNDEIEKITELLTKESDVILADGIRADIREILNENKVIKIDYKKLRSIYENASKSMQGGQVKLISEKILPSLNEIQSMLLDFKPNSNLKNGIELTPNEFETLKNKILEYANEKICKIEGPASGHKSYINSNVIKFKNAFNTEKSVIINNEVISKMVRFADIIGDFKNKSAILDKCINFKFAYTPESILANYYEKFQKTLIKQLDISPKDYKRISNDKEFAAKILDQKFLELSKDEAKFKSTFEKLGKIISNMEKALHGSANDNSYIMDLINGINGLYNNTAQALIDNEVGKTTVNRLVKGDFWESILSVDELNKLLDGLTQNPYKYANSMDSQAAFAFAKGKGSSKNVKISGLLSRYQGESNSFLRVLHTLDFYKRSASAEEIAKCLSNKDQTYAEKISASLKEAMLKGSISDFILKLGIENSNEYRDFYNTGWTSEAGINKGVITDSAKDALTSNKQWNLAEKLQNYIQRFKDIIANDTTDFTHNNHIVDGNAPRNYTDIARTNEAKFNLVGQSPVDMVQRGAGRMHADRMWFRRVGKYTGIVFVVALLAQFGFGKLKNKHQLQKINDFFDSNQKQVKNDNN